VYGCGYGELELEDLTLLGRTMWEWREADFVEFFPVQATVEISACRDGSREEDTRSVDCLEDTDNVTTTCNFGDENGC